MPSPWSLPAAVTINATTDAIAIDQQNNDSSITTRKVSPAQLVSGAGTLVASNNLSDVGNAAASLTHLGGAPLASPVFTGIPMAPTAPNGTNNTQLATTAFVMSALGSGGGGSGVSSVVGSSGAVTLSQLVSGGVAPLASPVFTGVPVAPSAAFGTNTTQLATTAFVQAAIAGLGGGTVTSVVGVSGAVTLGNLITGGVAPLASPTFTGIPAAPTANITTNTTQIATTAFAQSLAATLAPVASPTFTGTATTPALTIGGNAVAADTGPVVNAASGNRRMTWFQSGGVNRWAFGAGNAAETAGVTLTTSAQTTSGTTLTFAATTNVAKGMLVIGTNIPSYTFVSAFDATTVTLSQAVSGTVSSGATIKFAANAGSDAILMGYDDFGNSLGSYMSVTRASNAVSFGQNTLPGIAVNVNGASGNTRGVYLQSAGLKRAFFGLSADAETAKIALTTTAQTNSGSNTLTFTSTTGVQTGMLAVATGIPTGTTVTATDATTVTLSNNASSNIIIGTSIQFSASTGSNLVLQSCDDFGNNPYGNLLTAYRNTNAVDIGSTTVVGSVNFGFNSSTPATNGLTVQNALTGSTPAIISAGVDTNVALGVKAKGNAVIQFGNANSGYHIKIIDAAGSVTNALQLRGTSTSGGLCLIQPVNANVLVGASGLAASATNGFIVLPNTTATPTGTPTGSGNAYTVVDSTNNNLWVYNGSAWKGVALTNIQATFVAGAVSAAGTDQGSATALAARYNVVTTVASGTGVILPASAINSVITVMNRGANTLNVFPNTGAQIESSGTNTAVTIAAGSTTEFICTSGTQWYSR